MTNQEVEQMTARVERAVFIRYLLSSPLNGFATLVVASIAVTALGTQEYVLLLSTASILALCVGSATLLKFNRYRRNHKTYFWNHVRDRGFWGEQPTDDTRLLIDKIIKIQAATPDTELLPMPQAIKLVDAYERQARQLELVKARMSKVDATRAALTQKISQLQALGENHSAGLRNLEQANHNAAILQKIAREIHSSCDRLEAITNGVRKTAQARQLRRELDQISAGVSITTQSIEPTLEAESLEEIERQIGREIEMYLQLERETEEHLR